MDLAVDNQLKINGFFIVVAEPASYQISSSLYLRKRVVTWKNYKFAGSKLLKNQNRTKLHCNLRSKDPIELSLQLLMQAMCQLSCRTSHSSEHNKHLFPCPARRQWRVEKHKLALTEQQYLDNLYIDAKNIVFCNHSIIKSRKPQCESNINRIESSLLPRICVAQFHQTLTRILCCLSTIEHWKH